MSSDLPTSPAATDSVGQNDQTNAPDPKLTTGPRNRRWLVRLSLGVYTLILISLPHINRQFWKATEISIWSLQDSYQLLIWAESIAWSTLCDALRFIPLGFLAVWIFLNDRPAAPRLRDVWTMMAKGFFLAAILAVFAHVAEEAGHRLWVLSLMSLVLPFGGCLLGAWVGANWLSGRSRRLKLLLNVLIMTMVSVLAVFVLVWFAIDDEPLAFEPAVVTSEDKRQLIKLFQAKDPRDLKPGEVQTLSLSSGDVNRLLSWGLSIGSTDRKALVRLSRGRGEIHCSVGVPFPTGNLDT